MINLTDGCCKGSFAHKARIERVKKERPEDFIFYTDEMGEWKFSELLESLALNCNLAKKRVREYVFDNLEWLCTYDVPSIFQIVKEHLEEEDNKIWFAFMADRDDNDWGNGTHSLEEAREWLAMKQTLGNAEAYIALIAPNGSFCLAEAEEPDDLERVASETSVKFDA